MHTIVAKVYFFCLDFLQKTVYNIYIINNRKRRFKVRNEFETARKYFIKKGKTNCLSYFILEEDGIFGIKIVYEKEENETFINEYTKKQVLNLINILSKNLTFPIELLCILEDLMA